MIFSTIRGCLGGAFAPCPSASAPFRARSDRERWTPPPPPRGPSPWTIVRPSEQQRWQLAAYLTLEIFRK